ncbi:MAG: cytochrome C oxidase subunit IV family protein [Candidatus Omnitrophica bacterium]|nr:cytochrome C oxidase subunit IV family protein [Candidatus Omnitrophota bacterium]
MTYKNYIVVWAGLTGLMLLGVALSYLPISHGTVVAGVLALSAVKAVIVGMYFMHLKFDSKVLTAIAVAPLPLAIVLMVLILLDKPFLLR